MLGEKPSNESALATGKASNPGTSKPARDDCYCDYCKTGHTTQGCFKLHEKDKVLSRIGGVRGIQANVAPPPETEGSVIGKPESSSFSKDEMDRLKYLLSSLSKPPGYYSIANDATSCIRSDCAI